MIVFFVLLAIAAFVCTIACAAGARVPLWVAVLILAALAVAQQIPARWWP